MSRIHNRIGRVRPRRNKFNLSYRKHFTCNMGELIPIMCEEVVPSDYFKIANQLTVRFQPLSAPIMHEIYATVHYFFVPTRILWNQWEDFIFNGEEHVQQILPRVAKPGSNPDGTDYDPVSYPAMYSLWDYFGFPIRQGPETEAGATPIDMGFRAYNMVWNEYYRDEEIQPTEVGLGDTRILHRAWAKDYFTSARIRRQRGQAPALPVNVNLSYYGAPAPLAQRLSPLYAGNPAPPYGTARLTNAMDMPGDMETTTALRGGATLTGVPPGSTVGIDVDDVMNKAVQYLQAQSTTFNISDLRAATQMQKWLERSARAGVRYTSGLQARFGVSPTDSRLDRPEYIGGTKCPIVISEVLQTSQTTEGSDGSPLGEYAGHGLGADSQYAGAYNVQEYGYIIGIMSIMPKSSYQDGINRQWLRRVPTDFYFPEFAHLSEQGIYNAEVYHTSTENDWNVWGFTGQYDEMRIKHDMVCGDMRKFSDAVPRLSYWHLTRKFTSLPPLNQQFISTKDQIREDIFAVQSVPGSPSIRHLIVNCQNIIQAVRPLPLIAEPGMMDHF